MLRRWLYLIGFITFSGGAILSGASLACAEVGALPGWTHGSNDSAGVNLSGSRVTNSSPVIAEVDGNTANGKEVVAAGYDGIVYAYHSNGSLLWEVSAPAAKCKAGRSAIVSSPAVGEIHGNGVPYVVIGYGGFLVGCDGGVIAINGATGTIEFNFSTLSFAKKRGFSERLHAVISSPGLSDTNGDGKMEIGFGSFDRNVYLLNHDGSVRWYYNAADTVWSSPSFADLNGDGIKEMIIGTDISGNTRLKPITKDGGNIYAFNTKAYKKLHYGFRAADAILWGKPTPLDQVIFSAPAVGEVIPSSPGPEILIQSGCFFPQHTNNKRGKWIKVLSAKGKLLRTLATSSCSSASPAIVDLDGDGQNEVVATVNGATSVGGDGQGHLVAFNPRSGDKLWDVTPEFHGSNYSWMGNFSSPVAQDLNGDGSVEIVASVSSGVGIFSAIDGSSLYCETGDCSADKPELNAINVLLSSPAIGDIDGDGTPEIVAAGQGRSGGAIFAWTGFTQNLGSTAGPHPSYIAPWPMFRGNASHTGAAQ